MEQGLPGIKVPILDKVRQGIPFFNGFGVNELRSILRNCQQVSYPPGMPVIQQGEISDNMYIIIQGEVEVSRNREGVEEILATLGAGECFGEMGIIEKTRRSATVKAKSECLLLAVSRAILDKVNPVFISRLYRNISSILSERLRKTSDMVEELQAQRDEMKRLMGSLDGHLQELDGKPEVAEAAPERQGHLKRTRGKG